MGWDSGADASFASRCVADDAAMAWDGSADASFAFRFVAGGDAAIASLSGAAVAMHTRAHAITARMIMGMCMVGSVWSS